MKANSQTINVQITASYANGNTANCFGESSASIFSTLQGVMLRTPAVGAMNKLHQALQMYLLVIIN
ncbi:MAG: hypothetical protein IPO27_07540 [Bacteroidetes bacterium]|nr:hypothetical protein [Bacteroidota bacterium]